MLKLTEVSPTAGLPLQWRDLFCLPLEAGHSSLETKIANFLGADQAQIECSGTAALVVALETLKSLSPRKHVVISAYTCPWVALAVIHCGLMPVLADSKTEHFDYCPTALKEACDNETLAVVHTHLAGRVADVETSVAIAQSVGAYVIEDAAQSLGAQLNGKSLGLYGDIGFYSLGVGKGLTIFAGGILVSKNPAIRAAMRQAGSQLPFSFWAEARRVIELLAYYVLYRPIGMGLAFGHHLRKKLKRGNLIAAVGDDCTFNFPLHKVGHWRKLVGLKAAERLPDFIAETRLQAEKRVAMLNKIIGLKVVADIQGGQGVWPFLMVIMPTEASRDAALAQLWDKGLGVGRLFIHALKDYDYLAAYFQQAHTPNAQAFAARTLIISNSLWLRDEDFLSIYEVLLEQVTNV